MLEPWHRNIIQHNLIYLDFSVFIFHSRFISGSRKHVAFADSHRSASVDPKPNLATAVAVATDLVAVNPDFAHTAPRSPFAGTRTNSNTLGRSNSMKTNKSGVLNSYSSKPASKSNPVKRSNTISHHGYMHSPRASIADGNDGNLNNKHKPSVLTIHASESPKLENASKLSSAPNLGVTNIVNGKGNHELGGIAKSSIGVAGSKRVTLTNPNNSNTRTQFSYNSGSRRTRMV